MAKRWPALDVADVDDPDLLLALLDDFSPDALEQHESGVRVFFATPEARDAAIAAIHNAALKAPRYVRSADVRSVDVDDEDWARRSQEHLNPVTVGRITIFPHPQSLSPEPSGIALVIPASLAFGTGHHATTRLCLAALQRIDLRDAFVLDVGTGSGVLAIAAVRLGAARALGLDNDPDAVRAARENLALNPGVHDVSFEAVDLNAAPLPPADIVTANLTAPLLTRAARALEGALRPGGTLILSGVLAEEETAVLSAFGKMKKMWQAAEDGWIGLLLVKK